MPGLVIEEGAGKAGWVPGNPRYQLRSENFILRTVGKVLSRRVIRVILPLYLTSELTHWLELKHVKCVLLQSEYHVLDFLYQEMKFLFILLVLVSRSTTALRMDKYY